MTGNSDEHPRAAVDANYIVAWVRDRYEHAEFDPSGRTPSPEASIDVQTVIARVRGEFAEIASPAAISGAIAMLAASAERWVPIEQQPDTEAPTPLVSNMGATGGPRPFSWGTGAGWGDGHWNREDEARDLSPELLRTLDEEAQYNAMLEWFGRTYEDPSESTPYNGREGGYQYNRGGPYDASEELAERFGHIVAPEVIGRLVEYLEEDGTTEWAKRNPDREEEDDEANEGGPFGAGAFGSGPFGQKPQITDAQGRRDVLGVVAEIRKFLAAEPPSFGGIGHNQPPEETADLRASPEDRIRLSQELDELEAIAEHPKLDRSALILMARNVWGKLSQYSKAAKARLTTGLGFEVAKGVAQAFGRDLYSTYWTGWAHKAGELAQELIEAVIRWTSI